MSVLETPGGITTWYASTAEGAPGLDLHDPLVSMCVASWLRSMVAARGGDDDVHRRFYEGSHRISLSSVVTGLALAGDDVVIALCMHALGRWSVEFSRLVLGEATSPATPRETAPGPAGG
jgi:hypothetical protein